MGWLSPRSLPAPYVVAPTWEWDGDAGNWSTFAIAVGTPPQSFRVLPSTSSSETWIPIPQGCEGILAGVSNCGHLRGIESFNGVPSRGFQTNSSSSWSTTGIYELTVDQPVFGLTDNALYGQDTVTVKTYVGNNSSSFASQTVAGISNANYWLGGLGLGVSPANFSIQNQSTPSLLSSMKDQHIIPSLCFGYTAGASYANLTTGSLVLGGYDSARFTPSNITFPFGGQHNLTLEVAVSSVVGMSTFSGTRALLQNTEPAIFTIDSSVSNIWLPQDACDLFADAFGLTYDAQTGLYLVNGEYGVFFTHKYLPPSPTTTLQWLAILERLFPPCCAKTEGKVPQAELRVGADTAHSQLTNMDPSVTFTISGIHDMASTTNIVMPYLAFDVDATIPIFNRTTRVFPMRAAANTSEYILGRAFLQEAYIFVDWERSGFTVGQAIHQNKTTDIIPMPPTSADSPVPELGGLSIGAVVGIVVACAVVAIGAATATFLLLRRRRRRLNADPQEFTVSEKRAELEPWTPQLSESMSTPIHELHDRQLKHELMTSPILELQGDSRKQHELEGRTPSSSNGKDEGPLDKKRSIHELP